MRRKLKFIFVTGGIVSGIGKGISVASISLLLQSKGFKVLPIKIDPYLNKDAGTMNPYQHGEVFVTEDGAETDLDLGHYERFIGLNLDRYSNFTTGVVYERVINMERRGDFLGKTIQIIPHVTDEIKRRIIEPAIKKKVDVIIVEIGGTVGDIEAEPFLEAARQILGEYGNERVVFVHVVKMDYIFPSDEAKTKPIQQSVMLLRQRGIQPDFLIVRTKRLLEEEYKRKISLFTNVKPAGIIEAVNVETVYDVPINFKRAKFDNLLVSRLNLRSRRKRNLEKWELLVKRLHNLRKVVPIALVGKYIGQSDAYLSVVEAVKHASVKVGVKAEIHYIDAEDKNLIKNLKKVKGIIVPGGFGKRGIEGKIKAIQYAREKNIPYLGLCLGLQAAVIEFARNVCKLKGSHSTEFNPMTPHPVVDILPEQKKISNLGGTMRLGASEIILLKGSLAAKLYGRLKISERHRHRYEINPAYHEILKQHGLVFSGIASHDKRLVEFIELPKHKFFIATQAHPEFKSRLLKPNPLFVGLIKSSYR